MSTTYYARHRASDNTYQPLVAHLLRVGSLMERSAHFVGLPNASKLIGVLHDLGKYTSVFQDYLNWSINHPNSPRKKDVDHSTAGGQYILYIAQDMDDISRLTAELIANVIFSHHTGLQDMYGVDGMSDFLRRSEKENILEYVDFVAFHDDVVSKNDLNELFFCAIQEINSYLTRISAITQDDDSSYFWDMGMLHKILLSHLVDADRLDSAEYEVGESIANTYDAHTVFSDFSAHLEKTLHTLSTSAPDTPINVARSKISDACLAGAERSTGNYQLSVPTGGGKTLASMRFALNHALRNGKKRIILVIPYTSIIDQTVSVLRGVFGEENVFEHHSDVLVKGDGYEDMCARWDVPIIVTTQVQFLNTLFDGRNTSLRRLQAIEDAVIVFDEVQTLPLKCTHLFNAAINFLTDFCGTTSLFCTATQPPLARLGCPVKFSSDPELVKGNDDVFSAFERVRVENISQMGGCSIEELADHIVSGALEVGSVLCIVNLTRHARELYHAVATKMADLDREVRVLHLSTKMCPAHRRKVLSAIKTSKNTDILTICISTQIVECGVDISFPLVYRALAGYPSIAQAAGRCNRNGEYKEGVLRLYEITGENLLRLPEINQGKQITKEMFGGGKESVLSQEGMQEYFARFYNNILERTLRYPLSPVGTIFDLLSTNDIGFNVRDEKGLSTDLFFPQAFRDAGKAFHVIDNDTTPVFVPYEGGERIAKELSKEGQKNRSLYKNLQKAQRFCVNLYSYEVERLMKQNAVEEQNGILFLKKEFYDDVVGVA